MLSPLPSFLPAAPKFDPAAPKPAERTGRRGAPALAMPGTPEASASWVHGVVATWNPRTHEGLIRAADGAEYPLSDGVLMRSGLVSLIPQMKGEFKIVAGAVDTVKCAWH
jgi:hypothetical protein